MVAVPPVSGRGPRSGVSLFLSESGGVFAGVRTRDLRHLARALLPTRLRRESVYVNYHNGKYGGKDRDAIIMDDDPD